MFLAALQTPGHAGGATNRTWILETMPTYEYMCDACANRWEEFQSITAEPTAKCPACKKKKARRLLSGGTGIIFKGSGFYETDYRSESYKQGADAASKATETPKESSGGDTAAKTEAAPAKAADSASSAPKASDKA